MRPHARLGPLPRPTPAPPRPRSPPFTSCASRGPAPYTRLTAPRAAGTQIEAKLQKLPAIALVNDEDQPFLPATMTAAPIKIVNAPDLHALIAFLFTKKLEIRQGTAPCKDVARFSLAAAAAASGRKQQ